MFDQNPNENYIYKIICMPNIDIHVFANIKCPKKCYYSVKCGRWWLNKSHCFGVKTFCCDKDFEKICNNFSSDIPLSKYLLYSFEQWWLEQGERQDPEEKKGQSMNAGIVPCFQILIHHIITPVGRKTSIFQGGKDEFSTEKPKKLVCVKLKLQKNSNTSNVQLRRAFGK